MKRILTLLLVLAMLLCLTACGGDKESTPTSENTGATANTTESTNGPTDGTQDSMQGTTDTTIGEENDSSMETTKPSVGNAETTNPTHTHEYVDKVTAATCTKEGYTLHTCSCGDRYTDNATAATGHNFGEWNTTKEPTTAATGIAERKCSKCNETETKVLGQLIDNHTHSYTSKITIQPTCKTDGQKTYSCSCGDTYSEPVASIDHQYGHKVTNPTCTNEGYTTYTCTVCGNSYRDNFTHPTGHNWKAATCTAKKTCLTCGETEGVAFGHSWKAATCAAPKTCKTCGVTEGGTTAHSWKAATCTAPKTCNTCGATDGSAVGHSWSAATCTIPQTCNTCGATEGKATGHKWSDGKCKVCSTIRSKYTTEKFLDELEGVSFTYTGISYYTLGSNRFTEFILKIRVTNGTDETIDVQLRNATVNGHKCHIAMSDTVMPNTTKDVEVHISAYGVSPSLNDYGEDIVRYVEFNCHVTFSDRDKDKFFTSTKDVLLYPYA